MSNWKMTYLKHMQTLTGKMTRNDGVWAQECAGIKLLKMTNKENN